MKTPRLDLFFCQLNEMKCNAMESMLFPLQPYRALRFQDFSRNLQFLQLGSKGGSEPPSPNNNKQSGLRGSHFQELRASWNVILVIQVAVTQTVINETSIKISIFE